MILSQRNTKGLSKREAWRGLPRKTPTVRNVPCLPFRALKDETEDRHLSKHYTLNKNNMEISNIVVTFSDGSTQTLTSAPAVAEVIKDAIVENTDGTSETLTPEASVEAAPVEEAPAA